MASVSAQPCKLAELHRRYFEHREPHVREQLLVQYGGLARSLATRNAKRADDLDDLGEMTGDAVETVIEGIEVCSARRTVSTSGPSSEDTIALRAFAAEDPGFAGVDERSLLAALLARLHEQEREMLELRFLDDWTQAQIAERLGCSQMQVSRMLTRALTRLRGWVEFENRGMPRRGCHKAAGLGA